MEYAKDQTIALGLATKGLKLDQIREFAELMKQISAGASSQSLKEFFANIEQEKVLAKSYFGD
jgi:hypothetical protein